jgi:cytochrome c553
MRRARELASVTAALLLTAAAARADQGDVGRGSTIANQGKVVASGPTNAVPPCRDCHGDRGIGDGSGAFPRLTGQLAFYVYKQLHDFAAETRSSPVMAPIAKALSEQDMQDVAAYYESVKGPLFPLPILDPELVRRGGMISAAGIPEKEVPACITCHGEAGSGMKPIFPYLAGQYASYLEYQMDAFRLGQRNNSPLGVMTEIARKMDDDDVKAVGEYLAAVRPPCDCGEFASSAGPSAGYFSAPLLENRAGK